MSPYNGVLTLVVKVWHTACNIKRAYEAVADDPAILPLLDLTTLKAKGCEG